MGKGTCLECGTACSAGADVEQRTAKDVMQYGVVSIDRKAPVHEAVMLLLDKNISGLVVTGEGRLAGMLSEKDLLRLVHKTEYLPGLVEDYMTANVTSFGVEDKLTDITRQLVESSFRRVPVLYQERLAGMITRADLIRAYKERFRPATDGARPASQGEVLAEDVMKHGLLTAEPDTRLYKVMDVITRNHITGLPVVDEKMFLLGIITEKDVLNCIVDSAPVDATVEAYMTTNVVSFDVKAGLDLICECLIERDFHRVPVVDRGRLVGIISRSDVLRKRVSSFKPPQPA